MVDNNIQPKFFIKNDALYFEGGEDDFREITMVRKWQPEYEPEYFDVWILENGTTDLFFSLSTVTRYVQLGRIQSHYFV